MNSLPTGVFLVVAVSMMYFAVHCGTTTKDLCIPCSTYLNVCNICRCNQDGSNAVCTRRGCLENETYGPLCSANEEYANGSCKCGAYWRLCVL